MSKVRDISGLANIIKTDANGNVIFVSGSTTLMAISSSGAVTSTGAIGGSNSTTLATTGSNTFTGQQYVSNTNTPVNFTDTASLYTDGGLRVGKDAYVSGTLYLNNLTVFGTQSVNFITSSQLDISDNIITVNTSTPAIRFGGIAVRDSGSASSGLTGSLLWDSQNNHWIYSNPSGSSYDGGMMISGPRNSSGLGNEQGTTLNSLMKGQGGDHITSSGIFESGSNVGIGTSTPAYTLDVQGTGRFTGAATFSSTLTTGDVITTNTGGFRTLASQGYTLRNDANNANLGGFTRRAYWVGSAALDTQIYAETGYGIFLNVNGNGTLGLNISSSGNVGIGTTSPTGLLSLKASQTNTPILAFQNESGGPNSAISTYTSATQTFTVMGTNVYITSVATLARFNTNYEGSGITFDEGTLRFSTGTTSITPTARMTINNTGSIGIGTGTPNNLLELSSATSGGSLRFSSSANTAFYWDIGRDSVSTGDFLFRKASGGAASDMMRITNDGNVGIGVTPSAWGTSSIKALQVGTFGSLAWTGGVDINVFNNAFYDGTNFKYIASQEAARYLINRNTHTWFIAPAGTAGNNITFTQAMTISSGGVVSIGTTSTSRNLNVIDSMGVRTNRTGTEQEIFFIGATGSGVNDGYIGISDNGVRKVNIVANNSRGGDTYFNGGGNVGIGTDAPGYRLSVIQTSGSPAAYFYNSATSGRVLYLQKKSADTGDYYIVCDNIVSNKFLVDGAGTIYAVNTTVQSASDIRFKENIRDLETGLSEILALKPRRFDWKEGKGMNIKNSIGFIAQEVEEVLPDLVKDDWINSPSDNTSYKSLGMTNMIPTLVKAIQEQQAQINELKAQING